MGRAASGLPLHPAADVIRDVLLRDVQNMGKLVVQELFRVAQGLLVGNAQMLAVFLQLAAADIEHPDQVQDTEDTIALIGKLTSTDPKNTLIGLKLTEEEATKLREYASKHDMTVTEVLQKGIDLQYAMEDSQRS